MKKHHSLIGLGLAVGLLMAPAVGAHAAGGACFRTNNVRAFRSVDDRTAYIRVSGGEVYELKLFATCLGVTWSHGVALRSRGANSSVCEGTGHWVEIYTRSGGLNRKCQVSEVRKLTAGEVAALPARARP